MFTSTLTDTFIRARMYRERRDGGRPRMVVIHDMEAPETLTMAEDLGRNWFANPINNGKVVYASTHYGVDSNSIVGYVEENQAAYGANGYANDNGVHIEHAGYARQTKEDWLDPYGVAMLDRSARLAADICQRHGIPVKFLYADDLRAGRMDGITTHNECSKAWGGNHTDPGPGFPIEAYLESVQLWLDDPDRTPIINKGDFDGKASLGESSLRTDKGLGVISRLQRLLIEAGYELPRFGADGDYGDETARAVMDSKADSGYPESTVVRVRDWTFLANAAKPAPEPEPEPPAPEPEPEPEPTPEPEPEDLGPNWSESETKLESVKQLLELALAQINA